MRKNNLFKKTVAAGLVLLMTASLAACDGKKADTKTEDKKTETKADKEEDVELQVFIAASLNTAMTDIAKRYERASECEDCLQCRQLRNSADTDRRRI